VYRVAGFVGQAGDPTLSVETLIPQLGVFGIVVLVFRWMLSRQDERDAQARLKDDQNRDQLLEQLEETQRRLDAEQKEHEATRKMLIELLKDRK
jgi:hypothetical protein